MAELNYVSDPRGLFTFPDPCATEFISNLEDCLGSGGFIAGTRVYRALLTQTGTNAPVATVLENTLGFDIVWTYSSPGVYFGNRASGFPTGRTMVFCGSGQTTTNHWNNAGTIAVARLEQDDAIVVIAGDASSPDDNQLFDTPIEVIIYPA